MDKWVAGRREEDINRGIDEYMKNGRRNEWMDKEMYR